MLRIDLSDFEETVKDLQHDVQLVQDLSNDQYFRDQMKRIINQNFEDVWRSQGAAINENWNGRTLVKTGNLRNSLTSNRLQLRTTNNAFFFTSSVPYASYVNDLYQYFGITPEATEEITELYGDVLKIQGRLNWTTNV